MSAHPTLSLAQLHAIESTERATASLSIASSLFVIMSFLGSDLFQTPINRLIFYATWGNILANVGELVGRSGLQMNEDGPLCDFQAFFLQWFVGADAFWIFCMALNVYLTLFRQYSPADLKKLEWIYFVACYGIPFVPALVFLFIKSEKRGRVYGSATMWCWIRPEWNGFRIAFFYGPIWALILATLSIHLSAAKKTNASRRRIKKALAEQITITDEHPVPDIQESLTLPADIQVGGQDSTGLGQEGNLAARSSPESVSHRASMTSGGHPATVQTEPAGNGEQDASHDINRAQPSVPEVSPQASQEIAQPSTGPRSNGDDDDESEPRTANSGEITPEAAAPGHGLHVNLPPQPSSPNLSTQRIGSRSSNTVQRRSSLERHTAAYLYSKRAILFFVALIITWRARKRRMAMNPFPLETCGDLEGGRRTNGSAVAPAGSSRQSPESGVSVGSLWGAKWWGGWLGRQGEQSMSRSRHGSWVTSWVRRPSRFDAGADRGSTGRGGSAAAPTGVSVSEGSGAGPRATPSASASSTDHDRAAAGPPRL
ncbi:hypothetical protein VTO42DRAFT_190 [Malbranchea cinnamomea]